MSTKIEVGTIVKVNPNEVIVTENQIQRGRYKVPAEGEILHRAWSLATVGQLQPIGAVLDGDDKLNVVFGFTRAEAARRYVEGFEYGGKKFHDPDFKLAVQVLKSEDEKKLRLKNITENVSRKELTAVDHLQNLKWLRDEANVKPVDLAKIHGRDRAWVSKVLALENLPTTVLDRMQEPEYVRDDKGNEQPNVMHISYSTGYELAKKKNGLTEDDINALLQLQPLESQHVDEYVRNRDNPTPTDSPAEDTGTAADDEPKREAASQSSKAVAPSKNRTTTQLLHWLGQFLTGDGSEVGSAAVHAIYNYVEGKTSEENANRAFSRCLALMRKLEGKQNSEEKDEGVPAGSIYSGMTEKEWALVKRKAREDKQKAAGPDGEE